MFAVATLVDRGRIRPGDTLVCASEGNHGRAVARAAREAGCAARVYLAGAVAPARVEAISRGRHGRHASRGTYDDAVRTMARDAARARLDRRFRTRRGPATRRSRGSIMLGYTRLLDEAEDAWAASPPDVIFVQAGVGGLLGRRRVLGRLALRDRSPARSSASNRRPRRACRSSVQSGRRQRSQGPFETVMGGLRCGEMSPLAFDSDPDARRRLHRDRGRLGIRGDARAGHRRSRRSRDSRRAPRARRPLAACWPTLRDPAL